MSTPPPEQGRPPQPGDGGPTQHGPTPGQQGGYGPPPGPQGPPPGQQGGYGPPPGQQGPPPGQQGGYGPPPGQPGGYPPPPPGQPGPPGPGGPPPASKPSVLKRVVAIAVGVVVLIVVGIVVTTLRQKDAVAPEAQKGDCVTVTNASATDTKTETVDCSDPKGLYEVASTTSGSADCPTADYTTYTLTAGNQSSTVCLVPNFTEGTCYSGLSGLYSVYEQVDCTSPDAEVKVALRADGQTDEALCDRFGSTVAAAYPDPARTYCLVAPDA